MSFFVWLGRAAGCMIAAVVLVAGTVGTASAACATGKLLHATFAAGDAGWDNVAHVKLDGRLTILPGAARGETTTAVGMTFRDADVCATLVTDASGDERGSAGIVFWQATSPKGNYAIVALESHGTLAIYYFEDGEWSRGATMFDVHAINHGANATNDLEVKTKGDKAYIFINGEAMEDFEDLNSPSGPSQVGLFAKAPAGGTAGWTFSAFEVNP